MLGLPEMRAHPRAKLGFVDELVGVGAMLERRLGAQEQGIDVGRGPAAQELARELHLVGEERGVPRARYLLREEEPGLDEGRRSVAGPVTVQVTQLRRAMLFQANVTRILRVAWPCCP